MPKINVNTPKSKKNL